MTYGQTNETVATNIARLRAERRWSLRELADMMPDGPGKLSHASIRELEAGKRRITVDELTIFAVLFGVSPLTLLFPPGTTRPYDDAVELTGTGVVPSVSLLEWLRGDLPLGQSAAEEDEFEAETFRRHALPPWAWYWRAVRDES